MQDLTNPEMLTIIVKLVLAGVLGGIIGFERDMHGRAAGLRTNLLVCMGSALFMLISEIVANRAMGSSMGTTMGRFADPGRIAAQIITGIGFIRRWRDYKGGIQCKGAYDCGLPLACSRNRNGCRRGSLSARDLFYADWRCSSCRPEKS